jgi:hypothetical protein
MRALLAAALLALTTTTLHAQEIETGTGVLCDTADQVRDFFAAYHDGDDVGAKLQQVNDHYTPNACAFVSVAYIQGTELATLTVEAGRLHIVEILVVGAQIGGQWLSVTPAPQVTAVLEKLEGA